jgi:macrolide-specific efflux system membrane fusion protein
VYYEAVIVLEKQELEILAGMSALVTVNVAEAKDAILVPTLALVRENNKVYVHLKQGNEYVLHEIQIGIANNFQAEVLSGLLVGDIILASVLDEAALQEMGIDGDGLSFF